MIFKFLKKKEFHGDIEFAFKSGGSKFFMYKDVANMPPVRAFAVYDIVKEFEMKCDAKYLTEFKEAMEAVVNSDKNFTRTNVAKLVSNFGERINATIDTDMLYKLASVAFFYKNEDTTKYDYAIAAEKIKLWKKEDMNSFFLTIPLKHLIDFSEFSNFDFQTYSIALQELKETHQAFHLEMIFSEALIRGSAKP